jgi:N-acetylneuraminic acid mutarotase
MTRVRLIPLVAAGLALSLVASSARAANGPMSVLNNPAAAAVVEAASDVPLVWTNAAPIPGAGLVRYAHAQCLGSNSFYVISGVAQGALVNNVRRYDAGTNTWTDRAAYPLADEGPAGVCFNGKIYVAGGSVNTTAFQIYDIAANTWTAGPPLPTGTALAQMGAFNGKVYVIGGDPDFSPGTGVLNVVNVYDIATNTWGAAGAPMPTGLAAAAFAQKDNFVYIVGGWTPSSPGSNANVSLRYDMAANTWSTGPVFTSARADLAMAITTGGLYTIGGDANGGGFFNAVPLVEKLDYSTWPAGAWAATTDPLPLGLQAQRGGFCTRSFFPAAGEIWSTGGLTAGFAFVTTNQYLQSESCLVDVAVAPAGLAVDQAGNGVMEPNEAAVVVAPSWRNIGAAIPAMTGAATLFTGPAGPTYTINDSAADYGALAVGATVSCTATGNCYTMTAAAATRPAVHWDSTFTETVTPPGTVKVWTLHVGGSFSDVPTSSPFYRFIETLLHRDVTTGCSATAYCPLANTTRDQMAVFVLIAKQGSGFNPPACVAGAERFADVPASSPFCKFIEELARRNVVTGCGGNNYCPTAPVTREQMAVFVLLTLDPTINPPACGTPVFSDVPASSPFCKWIEELARRGVVTGCGGGNYCPSNAVTREQMSVFLSGTFGLTLYGP